MSEDITNEELEANAGQRFVSDGSDFTFLSSERACLTCKQKHANKQTCEVFPKRIPKEILRGGECPQHKEK